MACRLSDAAPSALDVFEQLALPESQADMSRLVMRDQPARSEAIDVLAVNAQQFGRLPGRQEWIVNLDGLLTFARVSAFNELRRVSHGVFSFLALQQPW